MESAGVTLAGEEAGEGTPVVLLHGLTATRRYVVMGSRALERSGHRVVTYDARAHGASTGAEDPDAYDYDDLVDDLRAVMDDRGIDRAVLAGASMGAHTAMAFALAWPERVRALIEITPAYDGDPRKDEEDLADWDRLADGLERGGVDGFLEVYDTKAGEQFRDTVLKVTRQRLERHEHPDAVADALRVVPRSLVFEGLEELEHVEIPALVIPSRDEADPGHPLRVGQTYAATIPSAELVVEAPGRSPLAWQGGQLSRVIAELAHRAG